MSTTEREELFADFRREVEKREKEERRLKKAARAATFRELLTRLPDIHVVGEPELGNGNFFHTVMSMNAEFTPENPA